MLHQQSQDYERKNEPTFINQIFLCEKCALANSVLLSRQWRTQGGDGRGGRQVYERIRQAYGGPPRSPPDLHTVLRIRIRPDPNLFVGSGSEFDPKKS